VVRFYWDCLILLLIGYTCIVLPLAMAEFGFMAGLGWVVVEQMVNLLFLVDVVLNAHTGYVRTALRPSRSPSVTLAARSPPSMACSSRHTLCPWCHDGTLCPWCHDWHPLPVVP
jgi:hypothetical protein